MNCSGVLRRLAPLACLAAALAASPALAADRPAQQLGSLLLLPVALVAWGAFQAAIALLFPRWTVTVCEAVETRRGACLGWGAALTALLLLISVGGAAVKGPLTLVAAIIDVVVLLAAAFGWVGAAAAAGAMLLPSDAPGEDRTPLRALIGGLTLTFASAVPVLGWLLGLLVFMTGLGAAAYALLAGPRTPNPRPSTADLEPTASTEGDA
jgi:hypothetical protein